MTSLGTGVFKSLVALRREPACPFFNDRRLGDYLATALSLLLRPLGHPR